MKGNRIGRFFREPGMGIKILGLGILFLILLIPIELIKGLMEDRNHTATYARSEIIQQNGGNQTILPPVLIIPYDRHIHYKTTDGKEEQRIEKKELMVTPSALSLDIDISPEDRVRGIYRAVVNNSSIQMHGSFTVDRSFFNTDRVPDYEKSYLRTEISGQGLRSTGSMTVNGSPVKYGDISASRILYDAGLSYPLAPIMTGKWDGSLNFLAAMDISGGDRLRVIPTARETHVHMQSSWPSPGFIGNYLPRERSWNSEGFSADWDVFSVNHSIPRQAVLDSMDIGAFTDQRFGVELVTPVDVYQKSIRSVDYAALFLLIPFVLFLFIEILGGSRIHPIQYLLAGFADIIFYLLLIGLSEHIAFDLSFILAGLMVVILLSLYSASALSGDGSRYRFAMAPVLVLAYAFLYLIITSEDYALMLGSLLMFSILSIIMLATRKIDWYGRKNRWNTEGKSPESGLELSSE